MRHFATIAPSRRHVFSLALFTVILFALVIGNSSSHFAHAQSVEAVPPLTVTISPSYPAPYSTVTVTPGSTIIDLSSSNITFSVNGKVVQRSSGAQPVNIAIGGPGQTTNISVSASVAGRSYTKSIAIHPADVALIEEPISTTHPFYKGGPLLASQGRVRLIAVPDLRLPNGATIPAANLVYTWKNGDQILESSSGIGKSILNATAPNRYRDTVIEVTVASQNQSVVGSASITLSPIDPVVRIYQNDPLLGPLFNQALPENFTITDSERSFRAVPYFFSEIPRLTWQVNGANSQTGQDITVRPTGNGLGSALLAVAAKAANFPQLATASLAVTFGTKQATGIFGL